MAEPNLHVDLDLAVGSDPLAGTVAAPDGRRSEFVGWAGLATALSEILDRAVAGRAPGSTPDFPPSEPS